MVFLLFLITVALCVGLYVWMRHFNEDPPKRGAFGQATGLSKHYGTPPRQWTEDDPDFLAWVERKAHHLED